MNRLIVIEWLKLKRMKIAGLSVLVLLITLIIALIRWQKTREHYGAVISWNYLFPFVEIESSHGFLMLLVCLVTGYVFTGDYKHRCMEMYILYPYPAVSIYLSKLITVFLFALCNVTALFILNLAGGALIISDFKYLSDRLIVHHMKIYLYIFILLISIVPLIALISAIVKRFVVVVLLILAVYYVNYRFSQLWALDKLIWNIMSKVIQSAQINLSPLFNLFPINDYKPYLISAGLSFLLPLLAGIVYYYKKFQSI